MLKSLFNWKVLVNILVAVCVFLGLVWLTFRWLEYHTNHGQEIIVPNITDMSVQQAIEVLDDTGLKYEVDSFDFDPKYKPFQVLQLYPVAGSRVKEGSPIRLKVNPRTWAPVAIPDVIDSYKYRAFAKLKLVGLTVGDTIYEPSIAKDAVLKLMYDGKLINPGELVPRFSTIDVVVGQGPKRNIIVPNLIGLKLEDAKRIVSQNLFEPGLFFDEHDEIISEDGDYIVFYQNPLAGSVSDQGVQIDLWASEKTPAEMHSKIAALDKIYRISYAPSYIDESDEISDSVRSARPQTPVPAENRTNRTEPAPRQNPQPEPAEKPKENKKVIIE